MVLQEYLIIFLYSYIYIQVIFNRTKIYKKICLLSFFYFFFFYSQYVNLNLLFCKSYVYSTLYLILKFLGYAIYLMVDLNDFLTKFCLNNLISYVIYLWFFIFFLVMVVYINLCSKNFILVIHKMILYEIIYIPPHKNVCKNYNIGNIIMGIIA